MLGGILFVFRKKANCSYYLEAENLDDVAATTEYGVHIHAACEQENVFACQFHPEKSSAVGLKIIDNFLHV